MRELYRLFAEITDYPGPELSNQLNDCIALLSVENPAAAELLKNFQAAQQSLAASRLEEIYTSSFDMRPDCTPNLGYHLFGDDWRRSIFLAKLKELYETRGFHSDADLPDYLPLVLQYLSMAEGEQAAAELVQDGLIPALSRMIQAIDRDAKQGNPYKALLESLSVWLRAESMSDYAGSVSQQDSREGRAG